MSIYIPPKVDQDLLRSLKDIEQQLNEFGRDKSAPATDISDVLSRLSLIESRLNSLAQFENVAQPPANYKNDGNPSRVLHEDGTWLEPLAGITKAVPPNLDSPSRTRPSNLVNLLGSLSITGAMSADTVRTRVLNNRLVGCRAYRTTNLTVNTGAATVVPFDAEDYDTNAMHSTVSNTSRLTVSDGLAGYYVAVGAGRFAATATATWRQLIIEKNAAGTSAAANIVKASLHHSSNNQVLDMGVVSEPIYLVAGDYLELFAATGENTTLTYVDFVHDTPGFAMWRISA